MIQSAVACSHAAFALGRRLPLLFVCAVHSAFSYAVRDESRFEPYTMQTPALAMHSRRHRLKFAALQRMSDTGAQKSVSASTPTATGRETWGTGHVSTSSALVPAARRPEHRGIALALTYDRSGAQNVLEVLCNDHIRCFTMLKLRQSAQPQPNQAAWRLRLPQKHQHSAVRLRPRTNERSDAAS